MNDKVSMRVYIASVIIIVSLTIILGFATAASAENYDYDVPYLRQLDYDDIGESACAPTSIAMILQYYYPNSGIDVPDAYHAGLQGYSYGTTILGPATGYKDVSFASPNIGLEIVDAEFRKYYPEFFIPVNDRYSGLRSPDAAAQYLNRAWGGNSIGDYASFQDVINEIKERPLILNILYANTYGHYVVLRGYDDSNTPEDFSDDLFYINDPYTNWLGHHDGENRELSYATLSSWYSGRGRTITFNPALDDEKREYTTLVDTNKIQLDDINAIDGAGDYIWKEYYGVNGNWRYPNKEGHSAKWTPNLPIEGIYQIYAIFNDNNACADGGCEDIKYEVYFPENSELPIGMKLVKQEGIGWRDEKLGTFYLKEDSYVMIKDVPAQANVDAVRFEYISPPESLDLIFLIDTTGSMGSSISNVKASASEIVEAIDSTGYDYRIAIADYRDYPFGGYGGPGDYPYNLDLGFSEDKDDIIDAINGLTLGWGADWRESVYSGLVAAMKDKCKDCINNADNYGWRQGVNKAIILMGDAPPHEYDPYHERDETFDGDTCKNIISFGETRGCNIDDVAYWSENIDPILVYSVVLGSDSTTYNAFSEISERTGGRAYTSPTASDIVDTIIEVIEDIGEPIEPDLGVSIDIDPVINVVSPGDAVTYSIDITNAGTIADTYDISIDLENFASGYRGYPTSIQESWTNLDRTSVEIEPDATETITLTISVPNNWAGMEDVIYPFEVIAKSETDELISNTSMAELKVIADKRSMAEYSRLETIWLSELVQSSSVDDEIKNSLLDKLTSATLKLDQSILNIEGGKYKQANNMLEASQNIINAFINQVEAQYDKKIMQPDAEMLMEEANTILQDIESAKNM